ncbi:MULTISPECIES: acyl-CoA dehydrogenase family protein [unclassified Pantoea]|uniref:acyl-CoA dehydrogenase family protein n=1 Tax=unclassified Pantoea TaxID=2630326 RepID=UPI001CD68799|nr:MULTISPECIES: acyl-CoA dehydrogenase family protein [unclassified Pantoea]MCA1179871.1 acyl-CoA dehydrogenase family protein [Pantoea sp. alder69]MCA1253831.1 acyl-CoA dehydrogenase family protein [Pantoea sp. alder70]MCA1268357.1 acyl-CoA dehydrogenase family protein [Pantoea sp. alder81]
MATSGQRAEQLAEFFAIDAVERDQQGGTPKAQRDAIRHSGLLAMLIPQQFGGLGSSWREIMATTQLFARVDSSIAHVFGFHQLQLATVRMFARADQWQPWFDQTASRNWFWGNALNVLDERMTVQQQMGWYEFSGQKSFSSGAADSEILLASGFETSNDNRFVMAMVPSGRTGITIHDDWDNIGQRQTDSGNVTFERVRVEPDEMLLEPGPSSSAFASLRPLISQLHFASLFLGIAEGAFNEARDYTRREKRPWLQSVARVATEDHYVLHHYGEFWVGLESVRLLVDRAAQQLDAAWSKALALDYAERAQLALSVGTAKVAATQHGLDICNRLFDVTGARATHASLRFDRHWRNMRTQTLHDPVDYRIQELGKWALNNQAPEPSYYS